MSVLKVFVFLKLEVSFEGVNACFPLVMSAAVPNIPFSSVKHKLTVLLESTTVTALKG